MDIHLYIHYPPDPAITEALARIEEGIYNMTQQQTDLSGEVDIIKGDVQTLLTQLSGEGSALKTAQDALDAANAQIAQLNAGMVVDQSTITQLKQAQQTAQDSLTELDTQIKQAITPAAAPTPAPTEPPATPPVDAGTAPTATDGGTATDGTAQPPAAAPTDANPPTDTGTTQTGG